jgi:RNA polymerase sigma-70 factor, ECF subfamily
VLAPKENMALDCHVCRKMRRRTERRGANLAQIEGVYESRFAEYVRVAFAIVGDREQARDAVQDAFASAVRKRAEWRATGSLEAWLWRMVVNESRNTARAAARVRLDERPIDGSINGSPGDAEVRAALALLPERQRLALFLRYYADLDYRTIAATLGIAEGTVGAALSAARQRLREELSEGVTN